MPTSLYWRHKFLDAIRVHMGIGNVGGVIEVDEAFFRESFKGNHKKNATFVMPREPHRRGVKGSRSSKDEKRKRGISQEQVCVLCVIDRVGNIMTELICKVRMKHTDLERLFTGRIEDEAILCTDLYKSYTRFAQNSGVELQQIKRGKHKEGIYHIQHIDAFKHLLVQAHTSHSDTKLKDFKVREAIYI